MHEGVQVIDRRLIGRVLERARLSPRRRLNYNLHRSPQEDPNRLLNIMLEGTYVTPHRHLTPPKPELFLVFEGALAVLLFDDAGNIDACHVLGPETPAGAIGIDLPPGVWHSVAVLSPYAVTIEAKPGFYEQATDKEFAPWAPREGQPGAAEYLERMVLAARSAGC